MIPSTHSRRSIQWIHLTVIAVLNFGQKFFLFLFTDAIAGFFQLREPDRQQGIAGLLPPSPRCWRKAKQDQPWVIGFSAHGVIPGTVTVAYYKSNLGTTEFATTFTSFAPSFKFLHARLFSYHKSSDILKKTSGICF